MKKGMLFGNFELNPKRRLTWVWPKLFMTPKRDHVETLTNRYFYISSHGTLNKTVMAI